MYVVLLLLLTCNGFVGRAEWKNEEVDISELGQHCCHFILISGDVGTATSLVRLEKSACSRGQGCDSPLRKMIKIDLLISPGL